MVDPVEFDWDTCDASEAPETVVLLGAGASADAGLPTAPHLHQLITEHLGSLAPLYTNLASLVFSASESVDVERLFRVIQFVHALETAERSQDRRLNHEGLDIARLVGNWKPMLQEYLNDQAYAVKGTASGQLIDALWDALYDVLWIPHNDQRDLRYLRWLLMSMRGGTIATLNYDNSLERAAILGVYQPIDANVYPRDHSVPIPGYATRSEEVRIIRLHGCLSWATNADGSVSAFSENDLYSRRLASQLTSTRPPQPGIIFGAGNKLRAEGPYLDLYVEFKDALEAARRLIVIGYGWNDTHINELLRRWCQRIGSTHLMRISQIRAGEPSPLLPWGSWIGGNDSIRVQVFPGQASETIVEMMKPTPELLR